MSENFNFENPQEPQNQEATPNKKPWYKMWYSWLAAGLVVVVIAGATTLSGGGLQGFIIKKQNLKLVDQEKNGSPTIDISEACFLSDKFQYEKDTYIIPQESQRWLEVRDYPDSCNLTNFRVFTIDGERAINADLTDLNLVIESDTGRLRSNYDTPQYVKNEIYGKIIFEEFPAGTHEIGIIADKGEDTVRATVTIHQMPITRTTNNRNLFYDKHDVSATINRGSVELTPTNSPVVDDFGYKNEHFYIYPELPSGLSYTNVAEEVGFVDDPSDDIPAGTITGTPDNSNEKGCREYMANRFGMGDKQQEVIQQDYFTICLK